MTNMSQRQNILTAIAVTTAAITATSVSAKAEGLEITFTYDPSDSIEEIYSDFKRTARKACKSRRILHTGELKGEYQCRRQLLTKAVAASGHQELALYHERRGKKKSKLASK
jgi:hypothetical protein